MASDGIPISVATFILERIESVEQMEILLLLAGDPGKVWDADSVAREQRTSPRSTGRWLENLTSQKLLVQDGKSYRFPIDSEFKGIVGSLAKTYSSMRVAIIEAIFNKPLTKINTFAAAFRLRPDNDD